MKTPKNLFFDYDLIVIGSGAGGSVASSIMAKKGWKVAIIEQDTFGGDSPNWGDIPLATLLHSAKVYDEAKRGGKLGVRSTTLSYNYPTIRAWKDLVVKRTGVADNRSYYTKQGIATLQGKAHFLTPHEITVNRRHLSAKYFIVATGSDWEIPKIQGLEEAGYHTHRTILETLRPPKSLTIFGSGKQAIEIAQLMSIFGSKVTIIEPGRHILPEFDKEVGLHLASSLDKNYGITTLTGAKPLAVVKDGRQKVISLSRGGATKNIRTDEILVAGATLPNTDIGLENSTVKYTESGIKVNSNLRTNVKHIYAIGTVTGNSAETHATLIEGRAVAYNLTAKDKVRVDYGAMPSVVLSSPEVAQVGLNEKSAKKQEIPAKWATVEISATAISNATNQSDGFVKILAGPKGTVLGGAIVGPHASELIQEIGLAVKNRLTISQLAETPHAFLTWSEAIRIAAEKLIINGVKK